jgi:hypothetical protein
LTTREPSEQQIDAEAERTPSKWAPGPIWSPPGHTNIRDLPALFAYHWINSEYVHTATDALERDLAGDRKIIALLNAETIWNRPGRRDLANHFVVVTGIDTKAGVVHLNDSGIPDGRDEQIPISTFERAWAPYHNAAIVTKPWGPTVGQP